MMAEADPFVRMLPRITVRPRPLNETLLAILGRHSSTWTEEEAAYVKAREKEAVS